MYDISVTLAVSKLLKSKLIKLQFQNIVLIVVTLLVLNPLTSRVFNAKQFSNMPSILVTLLVLKLLTSRLATL